MQPASAMILLSQSQFARANPAHAPKFKWLKKNNKTRIKLWKWGRTIIIVFYLVFFQQSRVALGKRSPQDSQHGFFLYSVQASFSWQSIDLAWLLRRAYSQSVWIMSFEFVKVRGIRFSIWESFIGFYICCYPISTILACLFPIGVRISWKSCVEWEHLGKNGISCLLPCILLLFITWRRVFYWELNHS